MTILTDALKFTKLLIEINNSASMLRNFFIFDVAKFFVVSVNENENMDSHRTLIRYGSTECF